MRRLLPLLLALPLVLAACGGEQTVDADKAEEEISKGFEKQVSGAQVESIECDEDIKAEKGAKGGCKMTRDGDIRLDVSVTVTSEDDGGRIRWLVTGGTRAGKGVEEEASAALERQVGRAPDVVSCPERVNIKKGATTRCEVTADAQTYGATVTITDDAGGFDIQVDEQPTT